MFKDVESNKILIMAIVVTFLKNLKLLLISQA